MNTVSNPWVARLAHIDRQVLRHQMLNVPSPLKVTASTISDEDIDELKTKFSAIFLPTERVLDIAEYLVRIARSHNAQFYGSKKEYVRNIYMERDPLPDEYPAVNLTGPAGVGKTELLKRVAQCLDSPISVKIPRHGTTEQVVCWLSKVEENLSATSLLKNYLALDGEPASTNVNKGALLRCRRRAYRRGVCLIATDETQFRAFSSEATALITKTLMGLVRTGIPNVYVSNYSLGHRLARRGQEDRQRLLNDPMVLLPDLPDDKDWLWAIKAFKSLAPGLFQFDPDNAAQQVHFWTAGLKRLLASLFVRAAELAIAQNVPVTEETLEEAYLSTGYSMNRQDAILLHQQAKTNQQALKSRADLWCPYELPKSVQDERAAAARAADEQAVIRGYIESSMTPEEKKRHAEMLAAKRQKKGTKATVTPIGGKNSKADALKKADEEFRDGQ